MARTPTRSGPSQGQSRAGDLGPDVSVSANFSEGGSAAGSAAGEDQIVSGAELGAIFDLSDRSIREHRAKGHVFRLGHGYDYRRSVGGMLDHYRLEALRKALGGRWPAVLSEFETALEYRREVVAERDRLRAGLLAALAIPGETDAARRIREVIAKALGAGAPARDEAAKD